MKDLNKYSIKDKFVSISDMMTHLETSPVLPGTPQGVSSKPFPTTLITTTADKAGETTKSLYKMEVKATEASSISRMFDDMIRYQVGTKDIEKSARVIANQDTNKRGKTMKGGEVDCSQPSFKSKVMAGTTKDNTNSTDRSSSSNVTTKPFHSCSREPAIVVDLVGIKARQARTMARDARAEIWRLKAILKRQMPGKTYKETLSKIARARSRTWDTTQRRHKNKVKFLVGKHSDCCNAHRDQTRAARLGLRISKNHDQDPATRTSTDIHNNWVDPLVLGTTLTDDELNKKFANTEEVHMFNEEQVITYGHVDLDSDERAILQRRPQFATYDNI